MNTRKYVFSAICLPLLLAASCSKWLDVRPESEVTDDELFLTEAGFAEALNGIYTRSSEPELYGGELTIGMTEAMAQNYTISIYDDQNQKYGHTADFDFDDPDFRGRRDAAWSAAYHSIANCNLILKYVDERKPLLGDTRHALVKGETLALRAYLHFDLLRLFAPSYASSPTASAIPYVDAYSNEVTPLSTVEAALDRIITDLAEAKTLLAQADPILQPSYQVGYPTNDDAFTETDGMDLFLHNRRFRLNYYAVCSTLARVYLYKADYPNALENAEEVIESGKFLWTEEADLLVGDPTRRDRIGYKELVFAWWADPQRERLADLFQSSGETGLYIDLNNGRNVYEVGGIGAEDFRFSAWFTQVSSSSGNRLEVQKYRRENGGNRHPLVMPALRLSELYYIAAESVYPTNIDKAQAYLDIVRTNRGIPQPFDVSSPATFIDELLKEYRKELYAEGQLFYAYKRLHKDILGQNNRRYAASDNIFVLPFPDDEIEFGNR